MTAGKLSDIHPLLTHPHTLTLSPRWDAIWLGNNRTMHDAVIPVSSSASVEADIRWSNLLLTAQHAKTATSSSSAEATPKDNQPRQGYTVTMCTYFMFTCSLFRNAHSDVMK